MATGNIDQQEPLTTIDDYAPEEEEEDSSAMSLVDHLEELRWRLFKTLLAIAVGAIVAFIFHGQILTFLEQPLPSLVIQKHLTVTGIAESFTVTLMISIAAGFIVALPVFLYQTWAFISPGLYAHEKKHAVPFIFIGIILFLAGITLGYLVLHYPVQWLVGFGQGDFNVLLTVGSYFGFVAFFLLAFGVVFELPLVLTFMAKIGIITADTLKKKRATSHVGMWIAAAVIMPGADPYSPVILGVAMSFLYELTILFIRFFIKEA